VGAGGFMCATGEWERDRDKLEFGAAFAALRQYVLPRSSPSALLLESYLCEWRFLEYSGGRNNSSYRILSLSYL